MKKLAMYALEGDKHNSIELFLLLSLIIFRYIYIMAGLTTPPLLENTKCTFTTTEINHDLNPPVTAKILKDDNFQRNILNGSGTFCGTLEPNRIF